MKKFIDKITKQVILSIDGKDYHPKAKVLYFENGENSPSTYYKVFMKEDHAVLVYLVDANMLFFGRDKGNIGTDFINQLQFSYNGQDFKIVEKGYQYVQRIDFGTPLDAEGECIYWDCKTLTGDKKQFVNLGIMSDTGERGDLVGREISKEEIKIKGELL